MSFSKCYSNKYSRYQESIQVQNDFSQAVTYSVLMLFIKDIPVLLSIFFILLCKNERELMWYMRDCTSAWERDRDRERETSPERRNSSSRGRVYLNLLSFPLLLHSLLSIQIHTLSRKTARRKNISEQKRSENTKNLYINIKFAPRGKERGLQSIIPRRTTFMESWATSSNYNHMSIDS